MRRALALALFLTVIVRPNAAPAPSQNAVSIIVKPNGTCHVVGVDISCHDIGAKLREVAIPVDAWISFSADLSVPQTVLAASVDSLTHAGYKNMKIGYLTEPAR